MALFLSSFINKIDSKGRVSIPSPFRAHLAQDNNSAVVVYESFINECIEGCSLSRMTQISQSIDNLDPFSEERDAFATAILGGSVQLTFDSEGRVSLPENLLKKAHLKDQAAFVGKGQTFEIWEPQRFEEYMAKAKKNAKEKRNLLHLKHA